MICVTCGHENPPASRFCSQCGQPLQTSATCPRCGTSNAPTSKYCNACGSPLGGHSLAPAHGGEGEGAQRGAPQPTSFGTGRYQVERFLGEGGKKRVYLAHDTKLDRDIAFALLKTEGLDEEGRTRIRREAQAMARLGDHPHIVAVHDIGDEDGQPYLVCQYMAGGGLEDLLIQAEGHRLPIPQALEIADQICQALEHAHQQGIVHRDLKPGNVWLVGRADSQGGTLDAGLPAESRPSLIAKLGDFGLALSLDRSRLTQAGMMVGTVAYMSPEQALGGEVTPRSDLYSLGAMLYELVTGRPPFVGDESVAIITQHLNTPPVSPSWHVPDLPTGLEVLILRLLEKDPEKRPASAVEVREALRSSGEGSRAVPQPAEGAAASTAAGPARPSPLYRRIFVGREAELQQLQAAFDAALSGEGSLLMVVGEPGIGKTALCEQLATYVAVRGGHTLVGHCYEEGSHTLPYLPFVEALRSYVLARDADALQRELGSGAADVARIISEIRDKVQVELRPPGDPEDDRWRLFQAVSGFLRNASTVEPTVVVLEDLHWADRGALDLLLHLARNLQGARLLLVGTYRDIEVDRAHPLSAALAELRRVGALPRVVLRGLTPDEVHRMLVAISGQEVPWRLAELVHRQTEGNPLFVQEVLRYVVEAGIVSAQEGQLRRVGDEPLAGRIPEGLRDVIGKRLSRLSPLCNQVLTIATVIGREFRLDVLQRVAGMPEEDLYGALEEATAIGVIEQRAAVGAGVSFRFAHGFFRQVLYEEIFAPRRIRTHQQVGRALEEVHARRLEQHAADLAEHFAQSTEPEDLAKALAYSEMAARRSMQVCAYGEAVRLLQQALQVHEVLDPDDNGKRCDLLLALAEAQMPLGEPRRVADRIGPEAFTLAQGLGDRARASRACRLALEGLHRDAPSNVQTPEWRDWAQRADEYAEPESVDRTYADVALGRASIAAGRVADGIGLLRRALELARRLDDPELLFTCAWQLFRGGESTPQGLRDRGALAAQFLGRPRDRVSNRTIGQVLEFGGGAVLAGGDGRRAREAWRELGELAQRSGDAFVQINALSYEGVMATLDGRLEEAVSILQRMIVKGEELGSRRLAAGWAFRCGGRALLYLGQADQFSALGLFSTLPKPLQALVLAHLGQGSESQKVLRESLAPFGDAAEAPTGLVPGLLLSALEAAVLIGDAEAAGRLARWAAYGPPVSAAGLAFAPRPLAAAALLGDRAAALAHYRQGLKTAEALEFRPEVALAHLGLAEVLLDEAAEPSAHPEPVEGPARRRPARGEPPAHPEPVEGRAEALRAEAREHLDFAIPELQAMKMQPALERALQLVRPFRGE